MSDLIKRMEAASKNEAFRLFAETFGYTPRCSKAALVRKAKQLAERVKDIEFQIGIR